MKNNITLLLMILSCFLGGLYYWQKIPVANEQPQENVSPSQPIIEEHETTVITETNQSQTVQKKMSKTGLLERAVLKENLFALLNCSTTYTCPVDNSDPRASSVLLGKMLAENLQKYQAIHFSENYFDAESIATTQSFINYPDGHVQEQAINLMSSHQPDELTAKMLIKALENSYDAKIIKQSMIELLRYPTLSSDIQSLLQQSLVTGSFYVAQEIAKGILPFLSTTNINSYEAVAEKLPQSSKRSRFLNANIKEFRLQQSGGH